MQAGDIYALTGVSDPRLDPSGSRVAYVVWSIDAEESEYRGNIWVASVDGSTPPRKFTAGEKSDGSPRWSPDGSLLAFTSSRKEKEPSQLWVIPTDGGEPLRLTSLKEDVQDVAWSPDGTRIAFASRVRDEAYEEENDRKRRPRRITRLQYKLDNVGWTADRRTQIFVVPADGSAEPVQVTHGDFESVQPTWSPDGKRLAFASARGDRWDVELVSDIYLVDAAGGEPELLTSADAGCASPVWEPEGGRIAFEYTPGPPDDWPRHVQIAVVDAATREQKVLTASLDRQCSPYPPLRPPLWDEGEIVFGVEDRGNVHVYSVAPDGSSEPRELVGGELVVRGFDRRNGTLVHAATTTTTFSELFVDGKRVTDITSGFPAQILETERFTAVSPDGTEVDAWIVRPAGFEPGKRYPVLLNIHGGPFSQYGNAFFDEFQVFAGAGYAVVFSNPRGSSGYSEAWGRAIRGPLTDGPGWGTVDYDDLMAVTDEALRRFDFLDDERVGVLGGSYGGYMTSWIVGHTNRFKAAVSERAVNNLFTAAGSSDIFWMFNGMFGAHAHDSTEAWLERSPSTYARDIETPLLILHSEDDLRCNVEQAEHLFVIMRLLGKEVELVRFPAESHELSRSGSPVHRVMRFEVILEWFDRYLRS